METHEQKYRAFEEYVKRKIDRVDSKSSRTSRLSWFSFSILIIILAFGFYFGNRYFVQSNERFDRIEEIITNPPNSNQVEPTRDNQSEPSQIESRVSSLENLLEAIVATSKSALEQMNFIFSIVAAFFGLFALFFAYRQIINEEGKEKNNAEMIELVGSFRNNIHVVNDLIGTLKESFSYREKVEQEFESFRSEMDVVKGFKERAEKSFDEKVFSLNKEAYQLFKSRIDRGKFKSEENKGVLENFYISMNSIERMGQVEGNLSPFCFLLRALRYFNVTQYELSRKDLEESRKLGLREVVTPSITQYGEGLEDEVIKEIKRMLDDCNYHLGIIHYNLGNYSLSRERFIDAYSENSLDFRSRSYVPELMFFDTHIPFAKVTAEFSNVESELNGLPTKDKQKFDWNAAMASLKMRHGNCYLPKMIPLSHRLRYESHEDASKAADVFWEANKNAELIKERKTLSEVFIMFSLAQALELLSRTEWKDKTPGELFEEVFFDIRKIIILKTEPILLSQLNYVLAICASKTKISGESPRTYLIRARENLQHIPSNVLIFTPINKILLTREDTIMEMELFEKSLT